MARSKIRETITLCWVSDSESACLCDYVFFPFVSVGYSLVAINGEAVVNKCVPDGRGVFEVINSHKSFPLKLKFRRLKTSVNERIMLLSMFHSLVCFFYYTHTHLH